MNELKLENLKKLSGGAGPCGKDKGGNASSNGPKGCSSNAGGSHCS
jgi:hypothetical protein